MMTTDPLTVIKPSRLFWFLVLAQTCAVALAIGLRIVRQSELRPDPRPRVAISDLKGMFPITLNMFSNDCGRLPTTAEGLHALITCPTNISSKLWKGPYLESPDLRDPWGYDYVYRYPGDHNTNSYDLYSTGLDENSRSGGIFARIRSTFLEITPALLLYIPLTCGVCSIGMKFSPSAREFFDRNPAAHLLWVMTALIALMLFLASLLPEIRG